MDTTTELLTVDGVNLKTLAKNVESLAATLRRSGWRGGNAPVAGRQGSLWTPHKQRDEGTFNWSMWVNGSDDDGVIPGGSTARREFFKRVDELILLFHKRDALLDVRHTLPDASIRQAFLEVVGVLDFTTTGANPVGRIDVELTNPSGAAQDTTDVNQNVLTGSTLPALIQFSSWAGATEIMDELTITITGPITNPRLEAYRESNPLGVPVWVQYNGTVAAGNTLILNTATASLSGTGFTPTLANLVWSGYPRFLYLAPRTSLTAAPQLRVEGSGATAATAVRLVGRRKYGTW